MLITHLDLIHFQITDRNFELSLQLLPKIENMSKCAKTIDLYENITQLLVLAERLDSIPGLDSRRHLGEARPRHGAPPPWFWQLFWPLAWVSLCPVKRKTTALAR
jgi:hypothetical protein